MHGGGPGWGAGTYYSATLPVAVAMLSYYYGLPIRLPYYTGGYFWWYYAEDCLPYGL